MLDFGTDTPKLRLILSGFRGQLAPFITVHSPDSTKSGRCPYLAAKFAGTPRGEAGSYAAKSARSWGQLGRMRENEGVNSIKTTGRPLYCRRICNRERGRTVWKSGTVWSGQRQGTGKPLLYCLADNPVASVLVRYDRNCPKCPVLKKVYKKE